MKRLHEEAGVDYSGVDLDNLPQVTRRIFRSIHDFGVGNLLAEPDDPTFHAVDAQRRAALLHAVEEATPGWDDRQRETAAAVLDVLWHVPSYERLVGAWRFDGDRASDTLDWAIQLVVAAVEQDRPPPT
jgi:hypothetical protein